MLITILIATAAIIAIFLAVAAMQPSNFRVARSTFIAAPAGDAFAQVNDLHKWQEMSPYTKLDPNAKYTFLAARQKGKERRLPGPGIARWVKDA